MKIAFDSCRLTVAAMLVIGWSSVAAADPAPGAARVDFQRQVRPILVDKCFACHGTDAEHRKAELRLDLRDSAIAGGESGLAAITPGKPDESELIRRIDIEGDERMPPDTAKKPLTDQERQTLRQWIADGAQYQTHWAFTPPVRPEVPATVGQAWQRNDLDRFVLARLEAEGLAPSPEADRGALLRRLTLDLTGLPPTVAEVKAFLADERPEAYDEAVERLLTSPHYGERWGRMWLDGARYADSDGFEKDKPRQVWAYRDWVIGALNRDLPYDQFIIEQIAGDMLPGATQDQTIATGFLRNSMLNEEGGTDPEQFRMEAMFDRMDAIGKNVLALTIQCSQCHNHKYDPLAQEDYYRMLAFLNDTHERIAAVYPADALVRRAELLEQIAAVERELQAGSPDWPARLAAWEGQTRDDRPLWTVVRPKIDSTGGQKHYLLADGSVLCQGFSPSKDTTEFVARTDVSGIMAMRLEFLNDPALPAGGPGRSMKGTGALTEISVEAGPGDGSAGFDPVKIVAATADVNPAEKPLDAAFDDRTDRKRVTGPVTMAIDGKDETAWDIDIGPGRSNVPRNAVFKFDRPLGYSGGTLIKFRLVQNHGGWNTDDNMANTIGRFRFSVATCPDVVADPVPVAVREVLATAREQRTPAQTAALFSYWRTTVPEWREANDRIEALWRQHPAGTTQHALMAREESRKTFLLARGDFLKPTRQVEPGTPPILHALEVERPTRLDFARWLVSRRSPTAARAIANRIWQAYFGMGLVGTSEDFGLQGEPPSHGELLDWLAVDLMDRGWRLKDLHRLIVQSATYRQSARVSEELLARDPQNRLLARGSRFRLEAEAVRDLALAASGLLNPALGGPSVCPPAPDFLFQPPASFAPKTWVEEHGPNRYRRALYTFRFRSVPYPMLQAFDAPAGDVACVRRPRSNTPLQALVTLNEPLFLECARALGRRTLAEGGSNDPERLGFAFGACTGREPDEREAEILLAWLNRQRARFAEDAAAAQALAVDDPEHPPELAAGQTLAELAVWTATARVLLNLDETITRQ
jgi:hypothetical protein